MESNGRIAEERTRGESRVKRQSWLIPTVVASDGHGLTLAGGRKRPA